MKRDEVSVGDIITVAGYGGFAEVLHIEQDGYTPPPRSVPKYRATVRWGPSNTRAGSAKKTIQVTKQYRTNALIEDYPLGRCELATAQTADKREREVEDMDEAALRARLAELTAQLEKSVL